MRVRDLYITESKRIIDEYNVVMGKLDHYNDLLAEHKAKVTDMLVVLGNIELSTDLDSVKGARVNELMSDYDRITLDLETHLKKYIAEIEKLKEASSILYQKIITEYADIPEATLQAQIKKQLEEL